MPTDPRPVARRSHVSRRDFLKRTGWGTVGMTPSSPAYRGDEPRPSLPRPIQTGCRRVPSRPSAASSSPAPRVGPACARPASHQFGWPLPVRLADQQPSSALPFSDEAASTTDLTLKVIWPSPGRAAPTSGCGRSSSARA